MPGARWSRVVLWLHDHPGLALLVLALWLVGIGVLAE